MRAILTENLSKTYPGGKTALNDVNIIVEAGEIFGFLGPNGAGKTTAVKLLTGILTPTQGACRVFDIDPASKPEKAHAFSGVVTEHAQMYGNLTALENLRFYASLFGIRDGEGVKRAFALLEELDLIGAKDQKLDTFSTGMRQRLSLARALLHGPKLLFLDEPTSGLDPESALHVNHMIRRLAEEQNTTVFLCTHQLRYAQEICHSYGLIDQGRLLASGSLPYLRSKASQDIRVHIETDAPRILDIPVRGEDEIPAIVKRIVDGGGRVYHVSSSAPSLEEIYFSLLERGVAR